MKGKGVVALTASVVACGAFVSATAQGSHNSRVVVKTAYNKQLKRPIVVDGTGRTLYMWTAEINGQSLCAGDCLKIWPALTTTAAPQAGKGIDPKLLGVIAVHGKRQVTYNHHPLYTFHGQAGYGAPDRKPGDLNGQGLFQVWFVLSPKGRPIKKIP